MTIEQTVDIPASRRLSLELPAGIPAGRAYIALFIQPEPPVSAAPVSAASRGQSADESFRGGLRRAYGAWQGTPWENAAADLRAQRDEWGHRDPWNTDPAPQRR
jgi:hypothetical protein